MLSSEIRTKFFNFFKSKQHEQVSSSSLIPAQDPTLLFANAGMNQFKDLFLGLEKRSYSRAVTIQKCVRAGGKHNDLDNVGFTKRHLTFFEMMGNFSFGDYFKKEAIEYAWEFLTKHIGLPVEKLHATVYETDDQAYDIWHTVIGLPKEKIHRLGADSNFWAMGDVGPCGPCTEIFIDRGLQYGKADDTPASDSERFLEIWNLVFMQFDRSADGTLKPLKQTGVDTGMGLERLCLVIQNKDSVFQTDLFAGIIKKTEELSDKQYADQTDELKAAFHVLADHIRSSTLLIADGCAPSNDGRGYVLRKIIRRAALFAQKLSSDNIFPQLALVVIQDLGSVYPELISNKERIVATLTSEIEKFSVNLTRGRVLLDQIFAKYKEGKLIAGTDAFKLYDTYGFPIELIGAEARQHGYKVDMENFEQLMQQQKAQSGQKTADLLTHFELPATIASEFTGYQELETSSTIAALICNGKLVDSVDLEGECYVIAHKSPFFIVGGGQVPDQGIIIHNNQTIPVLEARYINNVIALRIKAPHTIKVGEKATSIVDRTWRTRAMKNHTATHLLQAALMELFGNQIKQSGSLVHPDYLRFDFTYHESLTPEQLKQVEDLVNQKIMENIPVNTEFMSLKEATNRGALAFFGDKYKPEKVRLVQVDEFSKELCGGTHVYATGDIGVFKITESSTPAAGMRRIVAVTGFGALHTFQECFTTTKQLSTEFKVKPEAVVSAVQKQKDTIKELENSIKTLKQRFVQASVPNWLNQAHTVKNIPFVYINVADFDGADLQMLATHLNKHNGFYVIVSPQKNGQFSFVSTITGTYAQQLSLADFAQWLKTNHNIRGGLQKNSIQGGGAQLPANFEKDIIAWMGK